MGWYSVWSNFGESVFCTPLLDPQGPPGRGPNQGSKFSTFLNTGPICLKLEWIKGLSFLIDHAKFVPNRPSSFWENGIWKWAIFDISGLICQGGVAAEGRGWCQKMAEQKFFPTSY